MLPEIFSRRKEADQQEQEKLTSELYQQIGQLKVKLAITDYEQFGDLLRDKNYILGKEDYPWPYFVIRSQSVEEHIVSIFRFVQVEHEYILSCGFDIFFHEIEKNVVLFSRYGTFLSAISLSSRETEWREVLSE